MSSAMTKESEYRPVLDQQLTVGLPPLDCPVVVKNNMSSDLVLPTNSLSHFAPSRLGQLSPLSLINSPLLLSSLREGLKYILIGGGFEACRQLASVLYQKLKESIFITAKFESGDDSYDWMMQWLVKNPSWANVRNMTFTTKSGHEGMAIVMPEENTLTEVKNKRSLAYLPSVATSSILWHKRHLLWVTRDERESRSPFREHREQFLVIRILTRSNRILSQILSEAKKEYLKSQEDTISILGYDMHMRMGWRKLADRPKRPLSSVILDPGVKDTLIADATSFLSSKAWYATRGIPFRRGYLLYGVPGSGKTSLIHGMAGELGLDIYLVSLSHPDLNDTALREITNSLPERCIALMEDIDAALTQSMNRESSKKGGQNNSAANATGDGQPPPSKITLSGLLNILDGVGAAEGRILFATTNKYSSLDPALCRPGRMDIHVEFKLASKSQARELYKVFYMPESALQENGSNRVASEGKTNDNEDDIVDVTALLDDDKTETTPQSHDATSITGMLHQQRAPKLSWKTMVTLADVFADAIPEREVSMAALQGYLMMYKTEPLEAAKKAREWVLKEKGERAKQENSATILTANKVVPS